MVIERANLYLIDTDMIINHLRKFFNLFNLLAPLIKEQAVFKISAITKAEIFAGKSSALLKQQKIIESIFDLLEIIDVTPDIAQKAGTYTRDLDIPLLDSLIAATAVLHQATLISRNTKHYQKISELKLLSIKKPLKIAKNSMKQ